MVSGCLLFLQYERQDSLNQNSWDFLLTFISFFISNHENAAISLPQIKMKAILD